MKREGRRGETACMHVRVLAHRHGGVGEMHSSGQSMIVVIPGSNLNQ